MATSMSLQIEYPCADCGAVYEQSAVTKLNCLKHFICNLKCLPNRVLTPGEKKDILCCSLCYDINTSPGIFIFVDDSNIWIEAKKLQSKLKRYKTAEDHRVRINVGKLADVLAARRNVEMGVLYGSEPPQLDTVWTKIKEQGWRVETDQKHKLTGKEKKVDTRLVAEATALAVGTPIDERTTIVLVSGDADVIPAIDQIMKQPPWKVEVCMWKHAMSREIDRYAKEHPERVQIKHLDDFLDQVSFTNKVFDSRNPELHGLVSKGGVVFSVKDGAFPKRIPTPSWLDQLEGIAQWPFQYYWFDSPNNGKTNDLVVVFKSNPKAGDFDIAQFISDIESEREGEDKLPGITKVQPFLQYVQSIYKKSDRRDLELQRFDYALEQVGVFDNEEAIAGSEEYIIFESDPQKGWKTKRRKTRSHLLRQQYSEHCPYRYNCRHGTRCQYQHSEEEKAYFKGRIEGRGNPKRKVYPCKFFEQVPPRCLKMKEDCDYAHGAEDTWCRGCLSFGHFTESCPKTSTPDP